MIILDYSGIAVAAAFSQSGIDLSKGLDENMVRHMILNSIRMYNLRYRDKYGRLIIACDSSSWRKDYFPEYKASRSKTRSDQKGLDWSHYFEIANLVKEEIIENFPYPVISVAGAEADDIIGYLGNKIRTEPVMIVSSDKDFLQLQIHPNVSQFSPIRKKPLKISDPKHYLFEHICRGDQGDGIPNIMSPDNSFTDGIRQTPMQTKKIETWWKDKESMPESVYRNFQRNTRLIDLKETPQEIQDRIEKEYQKELDNLKGNGKILNYLIAKRSGVLAGSAEDFFDKSPSPQMDLTRFGT